MTSVRHIQPPPPIGTHYNPATKGWWTQCLASREKWICLYVNIGPVTILWHQKLSCNPKFIQVLQQSAAKKSSLCNNHNHADTDRVYIQPFISVLLNHHHFCRVRTPLQIRIKYSPATLITNQDKGRQAGYPLSILWPHNNL